MNSGYAFNHRSDIGCRRSGLGSVMLFYASVLCVLYLGSLPVGVSKNAKILKPDISIFVLTQPLSVRKPKPRLKAQPVIQKDAVARYGRSKSLSTRKNTIHKEKSSIVNPVLIDLFPVPVEFINIEYEMGLRLFDPKVFAAVSKAVRNSGSSGSSDIRLIVDKETGFVVDCLVTSTVYSAAVNDLLCKLGRSYVYPFGIGQDVNGLVTVHEEMIWAPFAFHSSDGVRDIVEVDDGKIAFRLAQKYLSDDKLIAKPELQPIIVDESKPKSVDLTGPPIALPMPDHINVMSNPEKKE